MTRRIVLMFSALACALVLSVVTQAAGDVFTASVYTGPGLERGIDETTRIAGPAKQDLPTTVTAVVNQILTYVALAAVIGIIIAGLYMILSGGAQADRAKQILIWIVVGLFVVLLAKVIVNTVYNILGAGEANTGDVGGGTLIKAPNLAIAAVIIINAVLDYVALFAVIAIIVAGLYMILTGGAQADRAKQIITWTIIGLVVILLAKVIVITIYSFLGAADPNLPGGSINILNATSARSTIVQIVNTVLTFVGLAAVIAIIVAGLYLILGFGSESAKDRAKQIVIYTVVGLIIILLAKVIVGLPLFLLGGH